MVDNGGNKRIREADGINNGKVEIYLAFYFIFLANSNSKIIN